jgi:hypothetical protein
MSLNQDNSQGRPSGSPFLLGAMIPADSGQTGVSGQVPEEAENFFVNASQFFR